MAPRRTSSGPNGSPSSSSRCWKWLISMMPLRAAIPSTVKKPTSEPSEITAADPVRREHAADQRHRQREEREAPRAGSSRRTTIRSRKIPIAAIDREAQQPALRRLALGVLAEQLGVVLERERRPGRAAPRTRRRPSPRSRRRRRWRRRRCGGTAFSWLITFGRRRRCARRPRRRAARAPVGGVDRQRPRCRRCCRASRACSRRARRRSCRRGRCRRPPRRDQRGRRAADVAGLERRTARAAARSTSICDLRDVDLRARRARRRRRRPRPGSPRPRRAFVAQRLEVGAEEPHDDRLAGAGEHLLDPLLEVGLHVAVQAGVAVDDLLDPARRVSS